jgi:hypothetical protein
VAVRACAFALLIAADALFLWMFFSTDPLEQLAADVRPTADALATEAFRFAAAWRHGMAGNSWIYMPGFFAVAAAIWLHARHVPEHLGRTDRWAAGALALVAAGAAAPLGSAAVVATFGDTHGGRLSATLATMPYPSPAGTFNGIYTLLTWSVFVLACRASLVQSTVRPFAAPGVLTVGLVMLRPWTVDDFVDHWARGVGTGDVPALLSLALLFIIAALLLTCERGSAKPQPREAGLQDTNSAGAEHEQQVGTHRKQVEPR